MSIETLNAKIDKLIVKAKTKADYNQNDETASDYIKNRPFYEKEGQTYAFTENDYKTPYCVAVDGEQKINLFRLLDKPLSIEELEKSKVEVHFTEEDGSTFTATGIIFIDVFNPNGIPETDYGEMQPIYFITDYDDSNNLITMYSSDLTNLIFNYVVNNDINGDGSLILPQGVYLGLDDIALSKKYSESDFCIFLDNIKTSSVTKQIDKKFLPELISQEDINNIVDTRVEEKINSSILSVLGGAS